MPERPLCAELHAPYYADPKLILEICKCLIGKTAVAEDELLQVRELCGNFLQLRQLCFADLLAGEIQLCNIRAELLALVCNGAAVLGRNRLCSRLLFRSRCGLAFGPGCRCFLRRCGLGCLRDLCGCGSGCLCNRIGSHGNRCDGCGGGLYGRGSRQRCGGVGRCFCGGCACRGGGLLRQCGGRDDGHRLIFSGRHCRQLLFAAECHKGDGRDCCADCCGCCCDDDKLRSFHCFFLHIIIIYSLNLLSG